MIAFFEQRRIYMDAGVEFEASYSTNDRKLTYVKFVC